LPEKKIYIENAMLIDINGAYPNVLKKYGCISEDTFNYLMGIKKIDRLRAIGSLATNKIKLEIVNGEVIDFEILQNKELAQFYFLCCFEIGNILKECENISKNAYQYSVNYIENSFLFSWFDGIYIKSDHVTKAKIMEYIENSGYKCSVDILEYFESIPKNEKIFIRWKEKGKKEKSIILQNKSLNNFVRWKTQLKNHVKKENLVNPTQEQLRKLLK
jgi:hypothetical protein